MSATQAVIATDVGVVLGGTPVLVALDVIIPPGKVVGLIGPSGAGKTTLIRAIVGRQQLQNGSIHVYGFDAGSAQAREVQSYMTQQTSLYGDLTVRENLIYFATQLGVQKDELSDHVEQILAQVDMTDMAEHVVDNLSGGQKQRASLAVSLLGNPQLLALDEPTVGLDPVLRKQLWSLFANIAKTGKTLLVTSHSMDEAERCDILLLIRDGRIIAQGKPSEIMRQTKTKSVEDAFLKIVGGAK